LIFIDMQYIYIRSW